MRHGTKPPPMPRFFSIPILLLACCLWASGARAQQNANYTVSGFVKDTANGESLIGATVQLLEANKGTVTNEYGFYSLTAPAGTYTLRISYLGYTAYTSKINLTQNRNVGMRLGNAATTKEVVITGERADRNVSAAEVGRVDLKMDDIKTLPVIFGEVDVLKTIKLLPGVQSAGEGNAGFYVRGGGPDQNLVLLDEAVVYNASHLFGFFSVFNGDAINNVSLLKGGIPANYGGRVSSVLNIQMKEGNDQSFHAQGGIGLISSRLTVEGPLKRNKGSFIVSGRRTYIDVITKPFVSKTSNFSGSGYHFYDLNLKANYTLSEKDRLFLSGYFGRDVFTFKSKESGFNVRIPWGNYTATARWNHVFNSKLFLNTSLIFSDYTFATEIKQTAFQLKLNSGIRDYGFKLDYDWFPSAQHNVKFGTQAIHHRFTPSSASAQADSVIYDGNKIKPLNGIEYALYLNDNYDISTAWQVNAGLRLSAFQLMGPYTYQTLRPDQAVASERYFPANETPKVYAGLEPRITVRYSIDPRSSIKGGVTRNMQYVHLASTSNSTLPTDIWVPSTLKVKPQIGWQGSLGYFRNLKSNTYETSVEVYYKHMQNLIEYRDGAVASVNNIVENDFVFGTGRSYGAEFFVKKRTGKFTGWIGYTLAWTSRSFPDINNGQRFWAKYDRRHDLSLVGVYRINERWTLSSTFSFATGNTFSLPTSLYFFEGNAIQNYDTRNAYRYRSYQRLDFAATLTPKKKHRLENSWTFSVYNVYSRRNPYFIYLNIDGGILTNDLKIQAKEVSLFPIIPTVTWNFKI